MKHNKKTFWTLDRHHAEGFTLVELIVVIAILAILAGVAIPVYSGYIKKAETAADEQLLAAVNTAFAAACAFEGQSHVGRNDVAPIALDNGAISATYVFVNDAIDSAFDGFYEGGTFKVIDRLIYDAQAGAFKDPATAETLVLAYGGGFVKVTGAAINALLDSTYYSEGMDSEKLMSQVSQVAGIASGMGSTGAIMQTEGYVKYALAALGLPYDGNLANGGATLEATAHALALEKAGIASEEEFSKLTDDNPKWIAYQNAKASISGNALVLYTAKNTAGMGVEDAKALLNGTTSDDIRDAMYSGDTTGMNQAALAYGMYYAYVNSGTTPEGVSKNPDADAVIDALDGLDGGGFQEYLKTEQANKDMEAYLKALEVLNSSTESPEATKELVVSGFKDEELVNLLESVMGK